MAKHEDPEVKRWRLTLYRRGNAYGKDDPRTTEAARELAKARVAAAQAELDRWQAELDALNASVAA